MTKLRAYQEDMAQELVAAYNNRSENCLGKILALEMGLGKTVTMMRAAEIALPKNILVLCPAGARNEWKLQFEWHYPGFFNYTVCKSSKQVEAYFAAPKAESFSTPFGTQSIENGMFVPTKVNVLVTGYAPQLLKRIPEDFKFDWLILDECQEVSNPNSLTSKEVERIADQGDSFVFPLSGTPALDRPEQIWNVCHLVQPKVWGDDINTFRYKYMDRVPCEWAPSGHALKGLNPKRKVDLETKLARIMIRRTQEEVASDLPPLLFGMRYVSPKKGHLDWEDESTFQIFSERNFEQKNEETLNLIRASIAEGQTKFVVFTYLNNTAQVIASQLASVGVEQVVSLVGVAPDARHKKIASVSEFKGISALVCTIDSVGVALDFTWAHHGIFTELHFVPGMTSQAVKRFRRLSSKWSVRITFVVCEGTQEEKKVAAFIRKQNDLNSVVKSSESENSISEVFKSTQTVNDDLSEFL